MLNTFFKPPVIITKVDSISAPNKTKIKSFVNIYLVNQNEFYCSIHKAKKTKFIILKKDEIEKIMKKFPKEIYFIKTSKTAQYSDIVFVIDALSNNKIKNYAILDIEESDIIAIDKLKKEK